MPVWHSSITGEERVDIERVQKSALHIILGHKYASYTSALKEIQLQTLFERRRRLCLKFGKQSANSSKFNKWFKPTQNRNAGRHAKPKYCEVYSRLRRYEKSPISYLTNLLNLDDQTQ